jgi:hypothetical protein
MASQWYYTQGGKQCGPVSSDELKKLAGSGQLHSTDQIWKEGMAEWVQAGTSTGLFPTNATAPSRPTPTASPRPSDPLAATMPENAAPSNPLDALVASQSSPPPATSTAASKTNPPVKKKGLFTPMRIAIGCGAMLGCTIMCCGGLSILSVMRHGGTNAVVSRGEEQTANTQEQANTATPLDGSAPPKTGNAGRFQHGYDDRSEVSPANFRSEEQIRRDADAARAEQEKRMADEVKRRQQEVAQAEEDRKHPASGGAEQSGQVPDPNDSAEYRKKSYDSGYETGYRAASGFTKFLRSHPDWRSEPNFASKAITDMLTNAKAAYTQAAERKDTTMWTRQGYLEGLQAASQEVGGPQ